MSPLDEAVSVSATRPEFTVTLQVVVAVPATDATGATLRAHEEVQRALDEHALVDVIEVTVTQSEESQ